MVNISPENMKRIVKFVSLFITFIFFVLMIYGLMNPKFLDEEISLFVFNYGVIGLFVVSAILDLIPQLISPIIALGVGIIAGMNIYYAIIATIFGSVIGSVIGFAIGKKYMFDAVNILASKKSTIRLTNLTNKYGKIIVLLAAISPIPYFPVFLGAINFSKSNFLIYGILPRTLSIILAGYIIKII